MLAFSNIRAKISVNIDYSVCAYYLLTGKIKELKIKYPNTKKAPDKGSFFKTGANGIAK